MQAREALILERVYAEEVENYASNTDKRDVKQTGKELKWMRCSCTKRKITRKTVHEQAPSARVIRLRDADFHKSRSRTCLPHGRGLVNDRVLGLVEDDPHTSGFLKSQIRSHHLEDVNGTS